MVASALLTSPVFVTGRRAAQQPQQRPLVLARGCRPGHANYSRTRGSPFFAFQQGWGGPQQSAQAWQELFRAAERAFGSSSASSSSSSSNGKDDWASWQRAAAHAWAFPVDIVETETEYVLTADVPGLAKGDLKIRVNEENRTLTISGERRRPESQAQSAGSDTDNGKSEGSSSSSSQEPAAFQGKRTFERRMGAFERTFMLSEKADPAAVSARVERGVLTLTVLKKEREEPQVKDVPIWD